MGARLPRKIMKRIVPQRVVRKQKTAGPQIGIRGFEFPHHVLVRVQAVVDENVDASELPEQTGQNIARVAQVNLPPAAQPFRNKLPGLLSGGEKGRVCEAHRMETTAAVLPQRQ